jgi:uncharacterized DUF497 family protein
MSGLRFKWDPRKAKANKKKHGVSFEEAMAVFLDENALLIADAESPATEDRFLLLSLSSRLRLPVVCHCLQESESVIRLISARRAVRAERRQYEKKMRR